MLTPIETHVGGGGGGEQTGDYLEASLPSALLRVSDGLAGEAEGRGLEESSCCKPRHRLYRDPPSDPGQLSRLQACLGSSGRGGREELRLGRALLPAPGPGGSVNLASLGIFVPNAMLSTLLMCITIDPTR